MKDNRNQSTAPFVAYIFVVLFCAIASALIVLVALSKMTQITDNGMWAITVMALAPPVLGIGVSLFIFLTALVGRRERPSHAMEPSKEPHEEPQEGLFKEEG